jgi:DNA-binding transcriptional MerR regulator
MVRLFSISEMAKFSRVSRDTLLYYDKIGLFSPVSRGANNYRYYSDKQISAVNLIRTFQSLGMSLEKIKEISDHRTPEQVLEVLSEQIMIIESDVRELQKARKLLRVIQHNIALALAADETKITFEWREAEPLFIGPENDYSKGRTLQDALLNFYRYCNHRDPEMDLNYSAWGIISGNRIKNRDWHLPDRFCFNNPEAADRKPAGWYVIGYMHGDYGQGDELYKRLLDFIVEHDLEIIGDAYEAYLLNELSVVNPKDYLIQVSIAVGERHSSP